MTVAEALTQMTDETRMTLETLWSPHPESRTINPHEIVQVRLQGYMRKEEDGVLAFTELGQQVCTHLFGPPRSTSVQDA